MLDRLAVLCAAGLIPLSTLSAAASTAPIEIHRLDSSAIALHGDLSDPGWRDAARIDQFFETSPGDNTPPAVTTTAAIAYDSRYFYIGIRCEDPHPEKIRAPFVERDRVMTTDDYVSVLIDSRNDKRTAVELRVSPRGIQTDGVYNDGNGGEDFSPDYYFDSAASIDRAGWSVELRIPFSSLRYSTTSGSAWNILVGRNYPRDFTYTYYSAPIPRGSNCVVCHAQQLDGLSNLREWHHVVAAPYVTAQQVAQPRAELGSPLEGGSIRSREGFDLKWTPGATSAVDLTVNPDFSQIEADIPQITANQRFAVFYAEKRPFFLEGFDLFDTPVRTVYTRAITAPTAGIRNTGLLGKTAYTIFTTEDRGGGVTIIPGPQSSILVPRDFRSYDTVARFRRQVGRSSVGGVLTDIEIPGGGHNRVAGPDFLWRPNADKDSLTGEFLVSDNENPRRSDVSPAWDGTRSTSYAAHLFWVHKERDNDWGAKVAAVGDHFRADLGFVPQNGYREYEAYYAAHFYPTGGRISYVRPSVFADQQSDTAGRILFRRISPGVNLNGTNGVQAFFFFRSDENRVGNDVLRASYATGQLQIDPSRRLTRFIISGTAGRMIDFANGRVGRGASLGLLLVQRPVDQLTLEANFNTEWLDVTGGRLYTASVSRLKANYAFSARSVLRVIGQYAPTTRSPQLYKASAARRSGTGLASILYSYTVNFQTVVFLGYGDDRVITAENDLLHADRSMFFKVSYAFKM